MGGRSSSTSTVQNTTEQRDERVAATDQAIVVQLSDGSALELSDPGLIEAVGGFTDRIFDFADTAIGESLGIAKASIAKTLEDRAQEEATFNPSLKWIVLGGVSIAALMAFSKGRLSL